MNINQMFVNAIGTVYNGATVTAVFKDGRANAEYPAYMEDMLKSDSLIECVYDSETGEIL